VIRRAPQVRESSQARAKISLRTSSDEEFNYLPPTFIEENLRAFEELARRQAQDEEDLRTAHRVAQEEADQANTTNPLKSQFSTLNQIKKSKDEDIEWCSKKTKLRKYKSPIIDASIRGEHGSKKKDPKAIITIYRKDGTSTTHFHSKIETFGVL